MRTTFEGIYYVGAAITLLGCWAAARLALDSGSGFGYGIVANAVFVATMVGLGLLSLATLAFWKQDVPLRLARSLAVIGLGLGLGVVQQLLAEHGSSTSEADRARRKKRAVANRVYAAEGLPALLDFYESEPGPERDIWEWSGVEDKLRAVFDADPTALPTLRARVAGRLPTVDHHELQLFFAETVASTDAARRQLAAELARDLLARPGIDLPTRKLCYDWLTRGRDLAAGLAARIIADPALAAEPPAVADFLGKALAAVARQAETHDDVQPLLADYAVVEAWSLAQPGSSKFPWTVRFDIRRQLLRAIDPVAAERGGSAGLELTVPGGRGDMHNRTLIDVHRAPVTIVVKTLQELPALVLASASEWPDAVYDGSTTLVGHPRYFGRPPAQDAPADVLVLDGAPVRWTPGAHVISFVECEGKRTPLAGLPTATRIHLLVLVSKPYPGHQQPLELQRLGISLVLE